MKAKTVVISILFILLLALGILTTNQYLKASELQNAMITSQESLSIALSNRNTQINTLVELLEKQQITLTKEDTISILQTSQTAIDYYQSVPNNSSPHDIYQSDRVVRENLDSLFAAIPAGNSILSNTGYQTIVKEIKGLNSLIEENFSTYNQTAFDYNHEIDNFPILLFSPLTGFSPTKYYA